MFLLFLIISFASLTDSSAVQGCENGCGVILVKVLGLKNDDGDVKIGLYNSSESFSGKIKVKFRSAVALIQDGQSQCIFTGIPCGEYAIKLYHDEDRNDKLNTNFLGIPTEDYGFSNNAKSFLGMPAFDETKFIVSPDTLRIEIRAD